MIDTLTAPAGDRIQLATRFGTFDADRRSLVSFPSGLPGFEQCRRFAILYSVEAAPLQCLHAVEGPAASFLAIDPRLVMPEYPCPIGESDRRRLGVHAEASSGLLWLALLTISAHGAAFANLRAPVVINPATMTGCQLLPQSNEFPLRHPVALS